MFGGKVFEGYSIYGGVFYSGTLSFDAGSVTVPDVPVDGRDLRSAPFVFTGVLRAFDNFDRTGNPVFVANLLGQGVAQVEFTNDPAFGLTASRITYEFEDVAPVPEPATMILIGSGLGGMLLARRRKRGEQKASLS